MKDLQADDAMKELMNIGELASAMEYIEDQKKSIKALTTALELSNSLLTERPTEFSEGLT